MQIDQIKGKSQIAVCLFFFVFQLSAIMEES